MAKSKRKRLFRVIVPVERATGQQVYAVGAESAEKALELVRSGAIECEDEELEVKLVAHPDEWEVYDENGTLCEVRQGNGS